MTLAAPFGGNAWFVPLTRVAQPRVTVVAFPYGGGAAAVYAGWTRFLPPEVALYATELPGRGRRFGEPLLTDLDAVVAALLAHGLWLEQAGPVIFFGHSLGALFAHELTVALERAGRRGPQLLAVSGRGPPDLPPKTPPIHHLPDAPFVQAVRSYGGLPDEVAEHQELMDLFLPILRADFGLSEQGRGRPDAAVACALSAFGGLADATVDAPALEGWVRYTRGTCRQHRYPGGHFYLNAAAGEIAAALLRDWTERDLPAR